MSFYQQGRRWIFGVYNVMLVHERTLDVGSMWEFCSLSVEISCRKVEFQLSDPTWVQVLGGVDGGLKTRAASQGRVGGSEPFAVPKFHQPTATISSTTLT